MGIRRFDGLLAFIFLVLTRRAKELTVEASGLHYKHTLFGMKFSCSLTGYLSTCYSPGLWEYDPTAIEHGCPRYSVCFEEI